MVQYKRIFVIGHPGAGKALIAERVAKKLGWKFLDANLDLESRIGLTLDEIAGKQGVEAFYHCESQILVYQLSQEHIVVTTDGTIVLSEKNRQLLSSEFVVYLKVSTSVQLERVPKNPEPLLPMNERKALFDRLHHERDSLYEQVANIVIDSDDGAIEEHILRIVKAVEKNNCC